VGSARRASRRLRSTLSEFRPELLPTSQDDVADELDSLVDAVEVALSKSGDVAATHLVRALDSIPSGVILVSPSGDDLHRNDAAKQFLGARHSDALAEHATHSLLSQALQGAEAHEELELIGPPRRSLHLSASPLRDPSGTVVGAIAVVDDVSERRRLDAVRRDFVANIGHELKTPVGAISLLAETIVAEDDPDVVRRLASRIQIEAVRVSDLVSDLLNLAHVEAADRTRNAEIDLHSIVNEAADRVRAAAEHGHISLVVEFDAGDGLVTGDAKQIGSAIQNLLDNAIKYSDPGGQVRLSVSSDYQQVAIEVIDTGIGIPARDLERIFERFYRVDRARNRQTGGAGLGLAIVRHIAQNHGGDVEVESTEGVGSTFRLVLPNSPSPLKSQKEDAHHE